MKTHYLILTFVLLVFGTVSAQYTWPDRVRVAFNTSNDRPLDDILIRFNDNPGVTTSESPFWDARTLNCCDFIASMKGNASLAINTRPAGFTRDTVRLRIVSSTTGNFRLSFSEYDRFDAAEEIILADAYNGNRQNIKDNRVYDFSITADPASQGASRFTLIFVARQVFITLPGTITVDNIATMAGAYVDFSASARGKCGPVNISYSMSPGSFFALGTTTVTVYAADGCGNTASGSFTITVNDTEAPALSPVYPVILSADSGACARQIILTPPSASDNSGSVRVKGTRSDGASLHMPFEKGTTIVTWTATDASGNRTSMDQPVTVTDNEPPRILTTSLQYDLYANNGGCSYKVTGSSLDPSYTDNCSGVTIRNNFNGRSSLYGAVLPGGQTSIEWTATDASGNTTSITTMVKVGRRFTAEIPDASALPRGAEHNTLYIGYAPAAILHYTAVPAPAGMYNYSWSATGDIVIKANTGTSAVEVSPSGRNGGDLKVIITDSLGCTAEALRHVNILDIRCDEKSGRVQVCSGLTGKPMCISTHALGNSREGDYTLGGCPSAAGKMKFSETVEVRSSALVYPNPAKGSCILKLEGYAKGEAEIRIVDMLGTMVTRRDIKIFTGTELVQLDLTKLEAGMYYVRVRQGQAIRSFKLVVEQ